MTDTPGPPPREPEHLLAASKKTTKKKKKDEWCMITCLIYFTSPKTSAVTEPIYSDLALSVRQTKGKEACDETSSSAASNGISMNLGQPQRSGRETAPPLHQEGLLHPDARAARPLLLLHNLWVGGEKKKKEKRSEITRRRKRVSITEREAPLHGLDPPWLQRASRMAGVHLDRAGLCV